MNNQPIGARCRVCQSPRRADAEHYVRRGMLVAQAARAVGVDRRALARHMKSHAAQETEPIAQGAPAVDGPPDQVLDAIAAQLASMLSGRVSATQRLQILAEQRRLAESRARVVGPPPSRAVTVQEVDGLPELFAAFHEALKPWPDARVALAQVWRDRAKAS